MKFEFETDEARTKVSASFNQASCPCSPLVAKRGTQGPEAMKAFASESCNRKHGHVIRGNNATGSSIMINAPIVSAEVMEHGGRDWSKDYSQGICIESNKSSARAVMFNHPISLEIWNQCLRDIGSEANRPDRKSARSFMADVNSEACVHRKLKFLGVVLEENYYWLSEKNP
jgi:hypothetical protein